MKGEEYIILVNELRKKQAPFDVSMDKLKKKTNAILVISLIALATVVVSGEAIKAKQGE